MNYSILSSIVVLLFAQSSLALGSRNPSVSTASAEAFDKNYTREIPLQWSYEHNFDTRFKADFNGDGVKDRLHCDSKNLRVFVRNGNNLSKNILYWDGPHIRKKSDGSKRIFTGCEVLKFDKRYPSILVSAAFVHPRNGVRVRSEQFILQNKGNRFAVKHLRATLYGTNYKYLAAARSAKCTKYPNKLVKKGYRPGYLCFFAGYDSHTPRGYGTMTALIKIEERKNGEIVGKDLTGSSGLIWYGGIRGTPMGHFPKYRATSGSQKYDGLHMMGGAFLDTNWDGLSDLITLGQHASIRHSTMYYDRTRREGVGFKTSNVLTARAGNMTEFLSITAFNDFDKRIKRKCVYITGEQWDSKYGSSSNVHDHIRCYNNRTKSWSKRHDLPVKYLSSEYTRPVIKKMPNGKIWIRASQKKREKGATVFHRHRLFRVQR